MTTITYLTEGVTTRIYNDGVSSYISLPKNIETITDVTEGVTTRIYNDGVSSYISLPKNIETITDVSGQLGISETAIAGGMVEENDGYLDKKFLNEGNRGQTPFYYLIDTRAII